MASGRYSWNAHDAWHRFRVPSSGRVEILPRCLERNCATPTASRIAALLFVSGLQCIFTTVCEIKLRIIATSQTLNLRPYPMPFFDSSRSSVISNFFDDITDLRIAWAGGARTLVQFSLHLTAGHLTVPLFTRSHTVQETAYLPFISNFQGFVRIARLCTSRNFWVNQSE